MTNLEDFLEALVITMMAYNLKKQGKSLAEASSLEQDLKRLLHHKEIEQELEHLIKCADSRTAYMNAMKELVLIVKRTLNTQHPEALQSLKEPMCNFFMSSINLQKQAQSSSINLQLTPKTLTHRCKGHLSKGYLRASSLSEMGVCVDNYLIKSTPLALISSDSKLNDIKTCVEVFVEKLILASKNALHISDITRQNHILRQNIDVLQNSLSKAKALIKKLEIVHDLTTPEPALSFFKRGFWSGMSMLLSYPSLQEDVPALGGNNQVEDITP